MSILRRLYRVTAIFFWTLFMILRALPHQFGGWEGRRKIADLLRTWSRGVAGILNLRVEVRGKIPDDFSGLVVSNHLGYIDIITHGTVFPLRFTSTTVVARWPIFGSMIAVTQPVLVNRESRPASRKALRDFAKTMRKGMCLIVYPEGTSTDGKGGILPFKSTSFEAATFGDMPILPVLTRYIEEPGKPTVCWYGDMTLLPHMWQVLGLSSVEAELHILPPVYPEGMSRKEVSSRVHGLMEKEYSRVTGRDAQELTPADLPF